MIGVKCFFYGIIGFLAPNSEMYRIFFFSIYTGFSFWGALSVSISLTSPIIIIQSFTHSFINSTHNLYGILPILEYLQRYLVKIEFPT